MREFGYFSSYSTFVPTSFSRLFLSPGYWSLLAEALFLSGDICRYAETFYR
jgi:hypothetical protein